MGEITKIDIFGQTIMKCVRKLNLKKNLEIGSWDGTGSTSCFIEAMTSLDEKSLTCIEIKKDRFEELVRNVSNYDWINCINTTTLGKKYAQELSFEEWWEDECNRLKNNASKELVKTWFNEDIKNINDFDNGFLEIDKTFYDGVLIDGSEFTGYQEFLLLKDRTNVFFLDDCYKASKTTKIVQTLKDDNKWSCIAYNKEYRNGFAVFAKKDILP